MFPQRRRRLLCLAAAVSSVAPAIPAARATDLSDVLGVTHINGKSTYDSLDYVDQGANFVAGVGSSVIKLEMGSSTPSKYPYNSTWPAVTSLTQIAQTSYFQSAFASPNFSTYVITAYDPKLSDEFWLNGVTSTQYNTEKTEFYNLTKYLMQTYAGTGKTFVLEQWEGDWALRDANKDRKAIPTAGNVQGMIDWLNARQDGINQARAELGASSNVKVLGAVEVNRVQDAINQSKGTFNEYTVTNDVLPKTHMDLASYSSYDTEYQTSDTGSTYSFSTAVDYIASKLPSSAYFGQSTKSVGIGEFGVPEDTRGSATVSSTINNVVNKVIAAGNPYAVYWEIVSNEPKEDASGNPLYATPTTSDGAVNGYWMIKPDGTPGQAWHQYRYILATHDPNRANAAEVVRSNNLHLAYASNFTAPGAALAGPWSTNTSSGNVSVGVANGQVQMNVVANAASTPVGQATLNIASAVGRGLNPGEFLQFTLSRQNAAGVIGVSLFNTNTGSGINAGSQPLNTWATPLAAPAGQPANPAPGWVPISFSSTGTNPTYNWDTTDTLGLRLDSADGNYATVSFYLNGNYSGSWLYPTTATSLTSFSFLAQSNVLNSGFGFNNLALYTTGPAAPSTNYRWDPTHVGATGGGSGAWDAATTAQFHNGSSDVTWNYASLADTAVFGGAAGTVTVTGNVTASTLSFASTGYTLTGGTLTMMGNQTISAAAGTATTVNTALAGTTGLTLAGPGTVTLGGTNTFTGGLYVTSGATAAFTVDANLGGASQPISLNGGTLSFRGAPGLTDTTRAITIGPAGGTLDTPNKYVLNGANFLTGSGNITKTGASILTIYGAGNNASGNWTINGGTVEVGTAAGLGTGPVTVDAGAELSSTVPTPIANAVTLNAGSTLSADFNSTGTGTFAGPVTVAGNANVRLGNFWSATSQSVSLTGKLTGAGTLTTIPASGATSSTGRLTVAADNSAFAGGFVVGAGTLVAPLTNKNVLGAGRITLAGGGLALQGQLGSVGAVGAVAPVAVNGFNKDTIYAATETGKYPSGDSTNNTLMDGFFSYYQNGFTPPTGSLNAGTALTGGLAGTAITASATGTPFTLQSLTAANTLQINQGLTGTLTLSTPAAMATLAVLATSSWAADDTPNLTINFTDGTSVTTTYKAYDWSIGTDAAKIAADVFGSTGIFRYSPTQSPGKDARPFGMYETDVDLTNINGADYSQRVISSLTFTATNFDTQNRGRTNIFAVSGAVRGLQVLGSQTYANPVSVTGDSSIDVTTSLAAVLGPLTIGAKLSVTSADPTASPYSLSFGPTSLTGNTTIDVASSMGGGTGTVTLGLLSGSGSLTKSGAGLMRLTAGGTIHGSLAITGGTVDVGSQTLVVDYTGTSPADLLRTYLLAGRNGTGGIVSSAAAADPQQIHAIGYLDLDSRDSTSHGLLVQLTLLGDANLDGQIDSDDFALLDRSLAVSRTNALWTDGDFNYDGTVTAADFALADRAYGILHGGLSPDFLAAREAQFGDQYVADLVASVPEPSCVVAAIGAGMLLRRRRGMIRSS